MTLPLLLPPGQGPDPSGAPRRAGTFPDDRVSIVIDRPDGTSIRWADDEPGVANVPADLTWSSSAPGGYKGASCALMRDLRDVGREGLFDRFRVLGPGGAVRFDGRLQQMPISTDGGGRVTPQAVGWQAALEDDATAREVYIDRDMGRWGAMSMQRRQQVLAAPYKPHDGTAGQWAARSDGRYGQAVSLEVPGYAWTSNAGRAWVELWYRSGGIPLGGLAAEFTSNLVGWTAVAASITEDGTTGTGTTLPTGGPQSTVAALNPGHPNATLTAFFPGAPAGSPNDTYWLRGVDIAVWGRHGLTFYDRGPLASDVIADALRRWAPGIRFTTGANGTITPTDYAIPHLVFAEPTTTAAIIERCNAFHAWDWFVWDDATFHYGPRGGGRTWRIATADGLDLSLEGETTDRVYTGVVVTFTDYAGVQRSIGPPGTSADQTDARLASTDPANPAVAHGLRRVGVLQLSSPSDMLSAAAIGAVWLTLQAQATRRGQATVTGWATDDTGAWRPVSEICGGDTLIVTDRPDDPPRRIIEQTYAHGPRANTLTLDSTAATLEALLEVIAAELVGQL